MLMRFGFTTIIKRGTTSKRGYGVLGLLLGSMNWPRARFLSLGGRRKKGNGLAIAPRQTKQYVGYPTQKPIALLERIIRASSDVGDIVFDPFCGSGTTLKAADHLGRKWIGIDISAQAVNLTKQRVKRARVVE